MLFGFPEGEARILFQPDLCCKGVAGNFKGVRYVGGKAGKYAADIDAAVARKHSLGARRVDESFPGVGFFLRRIADMHITEPLARELFQFFNARIRPVEMECVDQDARILPVDCMEDSRCRGNVARASA